MPAQKVKQFLDENEVKYVSISHSPAFTAQEIAASAHVPGKQLAKTVMVQVDAKMAMAVLPASLDIDFDRLREVAGAETVELASESEFSDLFPGCEPGAMSPFGNLYDMAVYVEQTLTEDREIAFNAGSHSELVKLLYRDFEMLVKPTVAAFGRSR